MAKIATFSVTGNGEAQLEGFPQNYWISQKGGVHEMIVQGGPIIASLITPQLRIPGQDFVPVLENNSPLFIKVGARPFHAFLVGLELRFFTENYDSNPVEINIWL